MNIAITFRHMDSTQSVKTHASDKVAKLQKFLRQPMKAQVTLSCQHLAHTAEIEIHSGGEHFHAHDSSEDMYATIDKVADKLERQIRAAKVSSKGAERASERLIADGTGED